MRLSEPRIPSLEPDQWDNAAQEAMKPVANQDPVLNIFKTLANHPDLVRR